MELDEMKAVWTDLSSQLESQKRLTREVILKMTQEKSHSRLGRIVMAESIGVGLSILGLGFITANAHKLQHWTGIAGFIGLVLVLLLGITFGLRIIRKARKINVLENTYSEVIRHFDEFRALLRLYKKFSIWISVLSTVLVVPVMTEIFLEKNVLEIEHLGRGLVAALILIPLVLYGFIRFYSSNVSAVKRALKDIDFDNE